MRIYEAPTASRIGIAPRDVIAASVNLQSGGDIALTELKSFAWNQ